MSRYGGSKQKLEHMLMKLEMIYDKKDTKTLDVTEVVSKLAEREDMETPHDDEKWNDLYKDVTFYDDVNEGKELDKDMVMKARKLEMKFFKKMGVYKKVDKSEVKRQGGKLITTR